MLIFRNLQNILSSFLEVIIWWSWLYYVLTTECITMGPGRLWSEIKILDSEGKIIGEDHSWVLYLPPLWRSSLSSSSSTTARVSSVTATSFWIHWSRLCRTNLHSLPGKQGNEQSLALFVHISCYASSTPRPRTWHVNLSIFELIEEIRSQKRDTTKDHIRQCSNIQVCIQDVADHAKASQYLKILWTFNVEKAPWWGGLFERMIKSTKRCLRKVVGRARLHHDELLTVLVEIEGVINSRPLTYLFSDDLTEPLTPSHFLCGSEFTWWPLWIQQFRCRIHSWTIKLRSHQTFEVSQRNT